MQFPDLSNIGFREPYDTYNTPEATDQEASPNNRKRDADHIEREEQALESFKKLTIGSEEDQALESFERLALGSRERFYPVHYPQAFEQRADQRNRKRGADEIERDDQDTENLKKLAADQELPFEGELLNNRYDDYELRTYPDGRTYIGQFQDNKFHGEGTLMYLDGITYKGKFKFGKFDGEGTLQYPNKSFFKGQFQSGKPHGPGILTDAKGTKVNLQFADGKCLTPRRLAGFDYYKPNSNSNLLYKGTSVYLNGTVYEGQFKDRMRHGEGILTLADGTVYRGQFEDNAYHGKGTLIYAARKYYEKGAPFNKFFQDSSQTSSPQPVELARYEGQFLKGCRHGAGTLTFADGGVYTGQFENDRIHGQGTYKCSKGFSHRGRWEKGYFVSPALLLRLN